MIQEIIQKIVNFENLTEPEAQKVMDEIMEGQATAAQMACFLTALRMKKETAEEITGLAKSMRAHALKVEILAPHLIDTCGTGGDEAGTFNISTLAGLVAAGAGVKVVKHGNRSVSSLCGSADVLEALGVKIDFGPDEVKECVEKIGFGFMFAPVFHKAMKNVAPVRKDLGIRTVFNILGPLASPAGATAQVLGVYHPDLTELMARVLKNLGVRQAFVVHGLDGLDEFSTIEETKVSRLWPDGKIENYYFDCRAFGLNRTSRGDLAGAGPEENARIFWAVLKNEEKGPKREIVLLNAAAALVVGEVASDLKQGLRLAADSLDSAAAARVLEKLIEFSKKH